MTMNDIRRGDVLIRPDRKCIVLKVSDEADGSLKLTMYDPKFQQRGFERVPAAKRTVEIADGLVEKYSGMMFMPMGDEPMLPFTVTVRRILRETPDGDPCEPHDSDGAMAIERRATFALALSAGEEAVARLCRDGSGERVAGWGSPHDYSISIDRVRMGSPVDTPHG